MRHVAIRLALLATALLAAPASRAAAQSGTIDPGMSRAQVVERLGAPKGERTAGSYTYLFFRNGCERACGMDDLVVLQDDAVVDAVFRSSAHHYTGTSSSPRAVPPTRAAPPARAATRRPAAARRPLTTGGRGGIVVGEGPATQPEPRSRPRVRTGVAGASAAAAARPADTTAAGLRARTMPGPVRVPVLPRDTQVGPPPRERGQRTMPGPVRVPTLPRDTQVARPDSTRPPR